VGYDGKEGSSSDVEPWTWTPHLSGWLDGPKLYLSSEGVPRALFSNEQAAKEFALKKNAAMLRVRNPLNYLFSLENFLHCCAPLSVARFESRVSEILGSPFELGIDNKNNLMEVHNRPPMFPAWASDEQMERIAALFISFCFYVEKIMFEKPGTSDQGSRS